MSFVQRGHSSLVWYNICCFLPGYAQDESQLNDLTTIFKLFSVFEIRSFANEMQLSKKVAGKTKEEIVQILLQHSQKQKTIFSFMKSQKNAMASVMSKK